MAIRKKDEEPVAANDPHVTPPKEDTTSATSDLQEYEVDGATYLLSPADAKARGAKSVGTPENKAVNPSNK
jgi:hypothetical protein